MCPSINTALAASREIHMNVPTPLDKSALRWRRWRLYVPLVAVIVLAPAWTAPAPRTRIVPASELTWTDVMDPNGSPLGLRTVDVWGNARQGAHGSLTKFPAGFAEPLHRHSNPIRVVVLSGIMRFVVDGVESVDLGPDSYISVSADVPHFARCAGTAPCEVLIEQDAAMDVKLGAK
jgi:mannose-6-phosphate isomerase-like protein (cupin superfamily)